MHNNGTRGGLLDRRGSESPLHHQHPRTVHTRLCLPGDSDSD